ncbi:MAG: galactokinase [Proteobacteria bacterium]|nr:galactokinase [Pseudomonadota bacterium]
MIITRTPLRISIGGGGTDLPSYYESFGGFVISAAINKYIYITVNKTFRPGYLLKYAKTEHTQTLDEIEHPLLRETLRLMEIEPMVETVSIADVPAGTGLGSSGSFTVGLLHALHAYKRRKISTEEMARMANHIEMTILGEPCGKQDHYIAAYGGLTCQEYAADGSVTITPLMVSDTTIRDLNENLMLFFTGVSRDATEVAAEQVRNTPHRKSELREMVALVDEATRLLSGTDPLREFGYLLHQTWMLKRRLSSRISTPLVDDIYEKARGAGAHAGGVDAPGEGVDQRVRVQPTVAHVEDHQLEDHRLGRQDRRGGL